MKTRNTWRMAVVALTVVGVLTGCGHISNNTPMANSTAGNNVSESSQTNNTVTTNTTPTTISNSAITYLSYHNTSYDFSVAYPSNWTELPTPIDNDGTAFTFNTQNIKYSNMMEGYFKHDAVIIAVGAYNMANWTYAEAKKKPNDSSILSYACY